MTDFFKYTCTHQEGKARAGTFTTPHGNIETPMFMPVGTQATVKTLTPHHLHDLGAQIILSNTYHLYLRPGSDIVAELGGLHQFMNWNKPILTDSGGFQVFSLSDTRKICENGVLFKSHIDGSSHELTPEKSIAVQEDLGADIIMAFDECAPPYDKAYNQKAMQRTHRWAERCLNAKKRSDQALFGIVQGGVFPDLREQSAKTIVNMDFPGYGIGGLSVGETKEEMNAMLEVVNEVLPQNKPRYLMGVGSPEDLIHGVLRGVDMFDCVLPTRLARHHNAMIPTGRINLKNNQFARDANPIDDVCECYTCQNFTRAYLRHLITAKESLSSTLISIHNLQFLITLMKQSRLAILDNRFQQFANEFLETYKGK
ncbi:MAG: tRNA guanosine(34) transglycosylase Tgt [Anaerolineaceae bacterium]|nr:tRNA guanosine(34) transglycosylase Tgt [Anaerolineaceae bacterium]